VVPAFLPLPPSSLPLASFSLLYDHKMLVILSRVLFPPKDLALIVLPSLLFG
jgi:hypothetical protein